MNIPAIDLSLLNGTEQEMKKFCDELLYAAHEIGFFYLVGHSVDSKLCDELQALSKEFFALPLEQKEQISIENSRHFRGYTHEGGEYTLGQKDWREEIDFGFEQEEIAYNPPFLRLYGPNQWPTQVPKLKEVYLKFQAQVTQMGLELLRGFSIALYGKEGVFSNLFSTNAYQHAKLIHYPGKASKNAEYSKDTQGCGAHKDDGFLTLLLVDEVGGLQVELKNGEWLDVGKKQGAFIINIGEYLELATDGYLKATTHRVKSPPAGVERYSIATFLGANLSQKVPVFELPPHLKEKMVGVDRDPTNPLIAEVGWNYLKHRLRSHPSVAEKFYSDIYDPSNPANPVKYAI